MPIASKRSGSHSRVFRPKQSTPANNQYDDYVYYPYYSKSTPNNDYEYQQEPGGQYEEQHYQTRATNNSAPIYRT